MYAEKCATYKLVDISINKFTDLLNELRKLGVEIFNFSEKTLSLEHIYHEYYLGD
ncbi:hypothetical protein FC32_GL000193 [Ligilactobacillus apodemi DSM 16634 = JCM 16172]|uniref:Uncharacterized protein n=1 Tax=Ligilactobacillus apodemi DSM 16634 = JCM 16172 TaxID=1423724 RepID=A0A0R1TV86_9LACO|nr:hypothetical protein FC32_GL000193 [Ligilactobacillus apodemi DSM 16634 = JCM 16172]